MLTIVGIIHDFITHCSNTIHYDLLIIINIWPYVHSLRLGTSSYLNLLLPENSEVTWLCSYVVTLGIMDGIKYVAIYTSSMYKYVHMYMHAN